MTVPLPVLWLCGAPGTGKSTVGWQLLNTLPVEDGPISYVDIDQLGMLYPAAEAGPGHAATKARNLAAVVDGHRAAGANALIVSGVLDPSAASTFVEACADRAAIRFCHLRLDQATLRGRLSARGWPEQDVDASMAAMSALSRATFVDATLDTSGRSVEDVVAEIRPLLRRLPEGAQGCFAAAPATAVVPITVVCGPRAVGKSSVSWLMFMADVHRGTPTGYVDLEQVSFLRPTGHAASPLKTHNLASIVATFTEHGARHVIANGMVDSSTAEALRGLGEVRIVRLAAGEDDLRARIASRATGDGGARLIGDDLQRADHDYRATVLETSLEQGRAYDCDPFEDLVVDTSASDPQAVAAYIASTNVT